jgi:DNA end-binding protein Ku
MAASWKGSISFGLIYIPISLYTAAAEDTIHFNQLHKKCGQRINQKKVCPICKEEVKSEDIVKGYQYEDGKYVVFVDDDFERIKTPKEKSITIEQFVDLEEIDPVYYEKSYYVVPEGGERAYQLLLRALKESNKVGIAKVVLGTKESLVALRPNEKGSSLLLNTMFFESEIKAVQIQFTPSELDQTEVDLAKQLIGNMTSKFEPEKFHNEYNDKLKGAIEAKINNQQVSEPQEKPSNVIDLMDALKKSLNQTQNRQSS